MNKSLGQVVVNEGGIIPIAKTLSWRESYEKAIQELDNRKLETEAGIFKRLQELASSSDHHQERAQIRRISVDLLAIKIHKLGWPDPRRGIGTES
jgi:hypothetical protein